MGFQRLVMIADQHLRRDQPRLLVAPSDSEILSRTVSFSQGYLSHHLILKPHLGQFHTYDIILGAGGF